EIARLQSDLKDAEENNVEDYIKEGLEQAIADKKAELATTQQNIDKTQKDLEDAELELEKVLATLDPEGKTQDELDKEAA
ncbi:cell surface protein, partial [Streptococcus pneumoniae]|nr:cell surface protein [Streptococcus pneumoniae]